MKKVMAVALAIFMLLMLAGPLPARTLAEPPSYAQAMADFARTQLGKTGRDYAASHGVCFEWCAWFTTFCASEVGICGTPGNPCGATFPPFESSTWEACGWAATAVRYQARWFTQNDKGILYYFRTDSLVPLNENTIASDRETFEPMVGDLIYFDWDNYNHYEHVAIVTGVNAGAKRVTYIGGNQGDEATWQERRVSERTTDWTDREVVGYMRPNYPAMQDELTAQGLNCPDFIQTGEGFTIAGTISSDASAIELVRAEVYDMSDNLLARAQAEPNTLSYNLNSLNSQGLFDSLQQGAYRYRVFAKNASGSQVFLNQTFHVYDEEAVPEIGEYNYPTVIAQGDIFILYGDIHSYSSLIESMTAGVYDEQGAMLTGGTVSPNSLNCDVSEVDNEVRFDLLEEGTYRYRVYARNAQGEAMLVDRQFRVDAAAGYRDWKQYDLRWTNSFPWPDAPTHNFGGWGDYATSMAILLRHYGIVSEKDETLFNPAVCNETLMAAGAIDGAGVMHPELVSQAYPGLEYAGTKTYSLQTLKSLLDAGYACIVAVNDSSHHVAIDAAYGAGAIMMDPGSAHSDLDHYSQKDEIIYFRVAEVTSGLTGDVNGDGVVTQEDALIILRYSLELTEQDSLLELYGDVNADSVIDASDALLVLRIALGV